MNLQQAIERFSEIDRTVTPTPIHLQLTEREILRNQERRALWLARELLAMLEDDEGRLTYELVQMEIQRRAGRQAQARAIHRVQTYYKTLHRLVKILESAEVRRDTGLD